MHTGVVLITDYFSGFVLDLTGFDTFLTASEGPAWCLCSSSVCVVHLQTFVYLVKMEDFCLCIAFFVRMPHRK